jgi:hypothetical protein
LESVAQCLLGVPDCEVIVVDNGSTDRTAEVVRANQESHPKCDIRYVHEPIPGLLSGRHRGAREAQGEILAYLDDDVLLAPTWWEGVQDAFRVPDVVLAGGPSLPEFEIEAPDWLKEMWEEHDGGKRMGYLSLIDQGNEVKRSDPSNIWGLNYVIRKTSLYECGGFHPDCMPKALQCYQGDGESGLSRKIQEAGKRTIYHPMMAVTHLIPAARMTITAFEQRGFYQGVCSSYGRIRREGKVEPLPPTSWRTQLGPLKRSYERTRCLKKRDTSAVRKLVEHAHFEGKRWHGEQLRASPQLLDWVMKRDYFDYRLPSIYDE